MKPLVTRKSLIKAMEKFDAEGDAIFSGNQFIRKSRNTFIRFRGKLYPGKAMLVLAHKVESGKDIFGRSFNTSDVYEIVPKLSSEMYVVRSTRKKFKEKEKPSRKYSLNPGMKDETVRAGGDVEAQHAKITEALWHFLNKNGFELIAINPSAKPDIFASREGERYLFEVKPDSSTSSLMMAYGQLCSYDLALRAAGVPPSRRILVLPKFDDGSELAGAIKSLFSASGMVILEFDGIKKMNRRRLNSLLGGQLY